MYFGSVKDVQNPRLGHIPAGQVFTDLLSYPAWLEMQDQPGQFFSRCLGRKVFDPHRMPAAWHEFMARRYPAVAKDPAGALKG